MSSSRDAANRTGAGSPHRGPARRTALVLLLLAPLVAAGVAQAQQALPRIGVLGPRTAADGARYVDAFRQGLQELGWFEGKNVVIEYRWADGKPERLRDLAAKHRLPAMFGLREHTEVGGLMSYSADIRDSFRRAAAYVDRILKGARPADLPIQQPTAFELAINLKTARALGLTIPRSLLLRADHVIE